LIFKRNKSIVSPFQQGKQPYTIRFKYHLNDADKPWALTQHIDVYRDVNDPIETITLLDGLGRAVQVKKDSTIHQGAAGKAKDMMSVAGHQKYDAFGRVYEQYFPMTENLGRQGTFNTGIDNIEPTKTEFDVLDRATKVTAPDNTLTQTAYGFGTDRDHKVQFLTRVTDANGIAKESYRNVRELITAIKEFNNGGAEVIWTSYKYDPLKQITSVLDDKNNKTNVEYDNLGRRTVIDNPDAGKVETLYDLASNV